MQRKPRQFAHTTPITLAVALAAGCSSAFAADPGTQVLAGAQAPISQVVLYPGVAAVERD